MRMAATRGKPLVCPCPDHEENHTHDLYDPKDILALDEAVRIDEGDPRIALSEEKGLAAIVKGAYVPTFFGMWVTEYANCYN